MAEPHILAAQFGAAVGIKGEVRVTCYLEEAQSLLRLSLFDAQGKSYKFTSLRPQGERLIARVEGIFDRTQAESLTRKEIFVAKKDLPKAPQGEYYHTDLIGLEAYSPEGVSLGLVKAVHNFGAGDLLEINEAFYPFNNAFVPEVDIAAGRLTLILPEIV